MQCVISVVTLLLFQIYKYIICSTVSVKEMKTFATHLAWLFDGGRDKHRDGQSQTQLELHFEWYRWYACAIVLKRKIDYPRLFQIFVL